LHNNIEPIGGHPFSSLEMVTTQAIQWVGEQITGEDLSEDTANNIQLGTDLVVVAVSKGKNSKALTNVAKNGITFPTSEELAKALETTVKNFHKNIKDIMKKDFKNEMKKINSTNPDIGIDKFNNIHLKNPKTGKTIDTKTPLDLYKD
jgi:predicted Mrr-cat superfamily restriction endonuclease